MARPAVIFGEAICDLFAPAPGVQLADAPVLVPMVGGAPANVAIQIARHGWPVQLLSALGTDPMGERVLRLLTERGVGVDHIARMSKARTGLLLIQVDADGERHFHPWRERAADLLMSPEALPEALIRGAAILHHGTVTLRGEPARSATRRAAVIARQAGVPVSVDVNLRPKMYDDSEVLRGEARAAVAAADVVKAAVEEAAFLFGEASSPGVLCDRLLDAGPSLALLTDGPRTLVLASRSHRAQLQPPKVQTVDSTGAGDAFMGTVLAAICEQGLDAEGLATLQERQLEALGQRAAAAGAEAVTALGATGAFDRTSSTKP